MAAVRHCTETESSDRINRLVRDLQVELSGFESGTAELQSMLAQLGLLLPVTLSPV